jgi:hypothetical protein
MFPLMYTAINRQVVRNEKLPYNPVCANFPPVYEYYGSVGMRT